MELGLASVMCEAWESGVTPWCPGGWEAGAAAVWQPLVPPWCKQGGSMGESGLVPPGPGLPPTPRATGGGYSPQHSRGGGGCLIPLCTFTLPPAPNWYPSLSPRPQVP